MQINESFSLAILDAHPANIAVLDRTGVICAVNRAWNCFGQTEGANNRFQSNIGVNYLDVCRNVEGDDASLATQALAGIEAVLEGQKTTFSLEYPCQTRTSRLWFLMQVTPLAPEFGGVIIMHVDISERKQAEEALRQSEARNRVLVESIPGMVIRVQRDGLMVDVKFLADSLPGVSEFAPENGKNVFDLLPSHLRKLFRGHVERTLTTGETTSFEYSFELHQHNYVHEAAVVYVSPNEAIITVRDFTKRRQEEQELRQREQFVNLVLDRSPTLIFVKDGEGRFLFVNQAFANDYGMTQAELIDQTNARVHNQPEEVAAYSAVDRQVIEGQQAIAIEEVFTKPSGEVLWYYTVKTPLILEDGKTNVLGISTNITERKRMEEALRQSEARNRALLEAIPDVIARVRRDGVYLEIKDTANFKSIRPVEELLGHKQAEVLPAEMARQFAHHNQLALETGTLQTFEYQLHEGDILRTREARIVPVGHDEVIVILRDVSERKQVEEEKTRLLNEVILQRGQLRALTARLAEIQETERKHLARELHDQVGQNLTVLALNLKMLQSQLPAKVSASDPIKARLEDSLTLLEQTTVTIRSVMTDLRPPVLDDYGLLATLHWYCSSVMTRTGILVDVRGDAPCPRLPETVENALFRIAQEAITNVIKHAKATLVTVGLTGSDRQVTLNISDNGVGFNVSRVTDSTKHPTWGLLNMTERAEAVGGSCRILSSPKQGTSIIVEVMR